MKHIEYYKNMTHEGDVSTDFLSFYIWLATYAAFYVWSSFNEMTSWKSGIELKPHILQYLSIDNEVVNDIFSKLEINEDINNFFIGYDLELNPYEEGETGVSLCNINSYLERFVWKFENNKIYMYYKTLDVRISQDNKFIFKNI